jgi:hypothetical protein
MSTTNPIQAATFLRALDSTHHEHTFQTFSDKGHARDHTRIVHGTLGRTWRTLEDLNRKGAGIFVTINETNGHGRKKSDMRRVRAVFVDLDGAPLPGRADVPLFAHIGVCSSPDRYHLYWLVEDVPLEAFPKIQTALATRYAADPAVKDTSRVMRLPGFFHQKAEPHLVEIVGVNDHPKYTLDDLKAAWPEVAEALKPPAPRPRNTVAAPVASTYAQAALEGEITAVTQAGEGTRNYTLNRAAFNLGTLISVGVLDRTEVAQALLDAALSAKNPLPAWEATPTIERGIAAGMKHPREGVA